MPPTGAVEAVISDFGGVLTSPLQGAFDAFEESSGVSLETLGQTMNDLAMQRGINPLYELELGRLSEADFLGLLAARLSERVGREVEMTDFGERYFAHLEPNHEVIAFMRELRGRGYRMAICTNNVREWEHRWRAMLPVDEIFEHVIDSAFVGMRKPDPGIYLLTLEQLGVPAGRALLIDDIEVNCEAARELGMRAVWFRDTEQAIADSEAALAAP